MMSWPPSPSEEDKTRSSRFLLLDIRPAKLIAALEGYVPALLSLGMGIVLTYISIAVFGRSTPALFFVYLMVILIGSWCGYGPGILNVLLVCTAVPFLFKPGFNLSQVNLAGVAILSLVSLIISRTAQSRREAETSLRRMNEELDRRVREKTLELQKANEDLHHQLAQLETLYSRLPVGLCLLDRNLYFVRVNHQLGELNGKPASVHVGRSVGEMLPAETADAVVPLLRRVFDTGEPLLDHEIGVPAPESDGQNCWLLNCVAIPAEDGRLQGLQVIVQDITSRKRAEEALQKANVELRQANSDLEQFAYSASHDLQEPLRMVAIYSQMLRKRFGGQLGQDGDRFIDFTVQGATHMSQLVKDLLAYTTATANHAEPAPLTDCHTVLQKVIESLSAAIAESGAKIEHGELPELRIRPVHLEQILQNLLSNAIKYRSDRPPAISVSAQRMEHEWVLAVSDNGIGIALEYRDQIFGLFRRLHTIDEYPGTGLGLAICQKIVERNQGRIWVDSNGGPGSTFYVALPNSYPATEQ